MRDLNFMLNGPLGFVIFVALTTFLFGSAPSYLPEFGSIPIEERLSIVSRREPGRWSIFLELLSKRSKQIHSAHLHKQSCTFQ